MMTIWGNNWGLRLGNICIKALRAPNPPAARATTANDDTISLRITINKRSSYPEKWLIIFVPHPEKDPFSE
jgi:hypothetical protein